MTKEKEPTQYPANIDPESTLPTTPSAAPENRCGGLSASGAATLFLALFSVILLTDLWSKTAAFEYLGSVVHYNSDGLPYLLQTAIREVFPGFGLEASLNLGAFNGWFSGMTTLLISISALSVPLCFGRGSSYETSCSLDGSLARLDRFRGCRKPLRSIRHRWGQGFHPLVDSPRGNGIRLAQFQHCRQRHRLRSRHHLDSRTDPDEKRRKYQFQMNHSNGIDDDQPSRSGWHLP